jgi:hypothetical protein
MHRPVGIDQVERLHPVLLGHPGQQLSGSRVLQRKRPESVCAVELEHARDDELAQTAVRVVEKPGLLSRAAA